MVGSTDKLDKRIHVLERKEWDSEISLWYSAWDIIMYRL
jgi:hypothetical protein